MKNLLGWLAVACIFGLAASFSWMHVRPALHKAAVPTHEPQTPSTSASAEEQEAHSIVTIHGPLLDYMARDGAVKVETLQYVPRQPQVGAQATNSPLLKPAAGGTIKILEKTFAVRSAVQLPFEVPAGAATPHLHGSYEASWKQVPPARDAQADIEFLVLNEAQYEAFLNARNGEATFSADDAHDQQVDARLPPTFNKAAEYHLIFRNNSAHEIKVVQADIQLDY